MYSDYHLLNKIAVVTGGAGLLGKGFASTLAQHGATVALVDKSLEVATQVATDLIRDDKELNVIPFQCDISNPLEVRELVNKVIRQFSKVDILVNNAATKTDDLKSFFEPFETYKFEIWKEVMSVNIDGMFLMSQAFGNQMLKQQTKGTIIQISSVYGVVAPDSRIYKGSEYLGMEISSPAVYSVSKAAVIGLTRYLAAYWGSQDIRVNSLSPGGIYSGQNEVFEELYSSRVPMGRMGSVEELNEALLFLASEKSSYMTGQNLVIDGGLTCW